MKNFIELTSAAYGHVIYVNVAHIVSFEPEQTGSSLVLSNADAKPVCVDEDCGQIKKRIEIAF